MSTSLELPGLVVGFVTLGGGALGSGWFADGKYHQVGGGRVGLLGAVVGTCSLSVGK